MQMTKFRSLVLLIGSAAASSAQGFGSDPWGNPNTSGGVGDPYGRPRLFERFGSISTRITAHAVLASIAVVFILPLGGILIRTGSFSRLWLIHGILQTLGLLIFISAVGLGLDMSINMNFGFRDHQIVGLVVLGLLILQPFLGLWHHVSFKNTGKRTAPSHMHIWIGRIVITLAIINGGLGLRLAQELPFARPTTGAIIGYSVVAGFIWLVYVLSTIFGEIRRSPQTGNAVSPSKEAESRPGDRSA